MPRGYNIANVKFPSGSHPEFLGEYAEAKASQQQIIFLSIIAVIAIVLILYVDFKSWRLVSIITLMLPLALLGGVVGVWFAGGTVSLGSLVGFVTILGIAARNGIMLLSHYRHLQTEEHVDFGRELFLRGAEERLGPDPDDRINNRPRPRPIDDHRKHFRSGNRVPYGLRHPRRTRYVHAT